MKVSSIQVSEVKEVSWNGRTIQTGIFKKTVNGPVKIHKINVAGDAQADRKYHGGEFQAVYSYASEHYPFWKKAKKRTLAFGLFGENLTTTGLDESTVKVGDVFSFGEVELQATLPRYPCFKLGIVFEDQGIIRDFVAAKRTGIYWRVLREGTINPGDPIKVLNRDSGDVTISDIFAILSGEANSREVLERVSRASVLAPNFKRTLDEKLKQV